MTELRDFFVQGVADLVDCEVFWFGKLTGLGVEGVFFEEEADFIAGGEEVVVADVFVCGGGSLIVGAGYEAGHWVVCDGEVAEEGLGLGEEIGAGFFREVVRDEEVAVAVELGELFGGEAGGRGGGRRRGAGRCHRG